MNEEANVILEKDLDRYYWDGRPYMRRNSARRRFTACTMAVCIGVSGLFGFAGGYLLKEAKQDETIMTNGVGAAYRTIHTAASGEGGAMTTAGVAAAVSKTVVEITTETVSVNWRLGQLISTGAGSGVIVSSDGYIVTNYHVVSGAKTITVRLTDGSEHKAEVRGSDSKTDLAVLKIDKEGLVPVVWGDSSKLVVGEDTVAIGNPLGELGGTVTSGIISALDREINIDGEAMSLMQTDAAINPGNSGGGLFNLYGELVGIVNGKSSGTDIEGLGFAIPVNTAKKVVEDIIANGYVRGRVDAGLTLIDIPNIQTAMMYRVNQIGLYISRSVNSELQSGDRIAAVDGVAVSDLASYNALMNGYKVGDIVQFTVIRNGQSITTPVTLSELRS